jgi:hypothetical protein
MVEAMGSRLSAFSGENESYNDNAKQIFKTLNGLEIDKALWLLDYCSRKLLESKLTIDEEFLSSVVKS